jgi:hypothetical protein
VSDTDKALHALLRLQKRIIGRGSGASCCTDVKIVKIREEFKTIKDALANLVAERDEARRMYCKEVEHHHETVWNDGERDFKPLPALDVAISKGWDCYNQENIINANNKE